MKNLFITAILIGASLCGFSASENTIKSKISHVTVFPTSAQVTRVGTFSATAGTNEIIFENVSIYLNTASIQAKGKGNFTILDVQFRYKQPEIILSNQTNEIPQKVLLQISRLEDSIAYMNFDFEELRAKIDALNLEKNILLNNQLIKGHGGDTIIELKSTMDYFRLKINDINKQIHTLKRQEFVMTKQWTRMNARLTKLNAYNQQQNPKSTSISPIPQLVVTINADYAISGSLEVNYMVNNAGWSPSYDLRTSGIDKDVELVYKANVWQNTGVEWNKAKLKLSTITPSVNNLKPILQMFYISYNNYMTIATTSTSMGGSKRESKSSSDQPMSATSNNEEVDANYAYNYTSAVQTMTNVEFDIKLAYTIPTDGKAHIIPIQKETIPTKYIYHIVPKIESQAFLIAKLTDWQKLDLLPGQANIYFDGTFVGETNINPSSISDTLELALGRDRSLQIKRKQTKNETEKKLVGSVITKTFVYEITLKNTKMVAVDIVLQDIIPITNDEDIKIELTDKGKATHTESSGMLQWNNKLSAGQTKKYSFAFTVEYDSAKPINFNL